MENAPLFVTWHDDNSKALAFATAAKAAEKFTILNKYNSSRHSSIYKNIDNNISVRDGMSRRDYSYFRPDESVSENPKDIIRSCRKIYRSNGLINNIVNLMTDFTVQGVRITHPNRKINKFYQEWWNKVNGPQISIKFAKNMYRDGISIVSRVIAKLKKRDINNLQKGYIQNETADTEIIKISNNEIPWKYIFLNPISVEPVGGDFALFAGGEIQYKMNIPSHIINKVRNPKNDEEKVLISNIPPEFVQIIKNGGNTIYLDSKKVTAYHYKKDDWELWADPMIYSVMDDVILLNKMKLADLSALDGAISHIRLWQLGSLEHKILPTDAAVSKLADILINNVGGGTLDLIWGPELSLKETTSDIFKVLGKEKYEAPLNAIYAALGIPPTLTGGSNAAGFTNNYISLQTLLERLNYVRIMIVEFWEKELKTVQKAMGFTENANIQFDRMTLSDEASEKMLLIQLADRNIISYETVQERYGEIPELERIRLKREDRERRKGALPRKAGPWFNPEHKESLEKIALQRGIVAPSQVGLELPPIKEEERDLISPGGVVGSPAKTQKGQPQQGRPINSKDKDIRKKRVETPKNFSSAEFINCCAWARKAQKYISEIIDPIWLEIKGKKDKGIRGLSDTEFKEIEDFKFSVLCSLEPYEDINEDKIISIVFDAEKCIHYNVDSLFKESLNRYLAIHKKEPTVDEIRVIQCSIFSFYKGKF